MLLITTALLITTLLVSVHGARPRQRASAFFLRSTDSLLKFRLSPEYRDVIFLVQGDVTKAPTEAITNSVTEYCLGGGGVDAAIHKAIGRSIYGKGLFREEIVNQLSVLSSTGIRCPLGTARSVKVPWHKQSYDRTLSNTVRWIIQASGPRDRNLAALELTYWAVLEEAAALGVASVAIPSISTNGQDGIKWGVAADVAVSTAKRWLDRHPEEQLQIVFYVLADGNLDAYVEAMRRNL